MAKNEWYRIYDGWFSYFVNKATGESKFLLDKGDILIDTNVDDFMR